MKIDNNIRIQAVKAYLSGGTLNAKAAMFKIHRNTLWRWVKQYREGGFEHLVDNRIHARSWNRVSQIIEDNVVSLKELTPSLTVRKACKMLKHQGIEISITGVWNIWQRYGFAGFVKEKFSTQYQEYIFVSPEIKKSVVKIKIMIKENEIEKAAKTINSLSVLSETDLLKVIPEHLLSLRRRADKLVTDFGRIPLSIYWKKAHLLRVNLEKKGMHYSSLRVGVYEAYALMWLGNSKEVLKLCKSLRNKAKRLKDPGLRFALSLFESTALGSYLEIPEALICLKRCRTILKHVPFPYNLMAQLAGNYTLLGRYREARELAIKALKKITGYNRKQLCVILAGVLITSGEYRAALGILKEGETADWNYRSRTPLIKAFVYLGQGKFQKASSLATEALIQSEKVEIRRFLHLATFILACCHAAMGEKKKAEVLLRKYNSLLKKYRLEKEYLLRKLLLGDTNLPKGALLVPNLRLAYLFYQAKISLKAKDYQKALRYAHCQKLFGLFERLALFFPEPVVYLLKKGKNPGLPKAFLKAPVFQIEPPVYHLRFLGILRVLKKENLISRLKLGPKDRSFLIHLSVNKDRRILLDDLYRNFWPQSRRPARNLSHLLVRIKKTLGLPQYLLRIRGDFLIWGFHLTTDYEYFEETLTQAKALDQTGEWMYAKREYMRAFALFRGAPFEKMYDPWSEHMRRVILNKLETEAFHFAKSCLEHDNEIRQKKRRTPSAKCRGGNMADAKKVLEKVVKIVPQSEESAKILQTL